MHKIAALFVDALANARAEARAQALAECADMCDHLAKMGTWEHTLGAAECANRIRSKLNGKRSG